MSSKVQQAAARLVEAHDVFTGNGAGAAPDWLKQRRQAAIEDFRSRGFPSSREEAWRFTDVKSLAEPAFTLAERVAPDAVDAATVGDVVVGEADAAVAVFVNGRFEPALSRLGELPGGVTVGGLEAALEAHGSLVEAHLGRYAVPERNPFIALNTAFARDGAFVHVPKDVVLDRPIQLVFVTVAQEGRAVVSHPRNLFIVERGAQASVIETYAGQGEGVYWTNAVTEAAVGENANVDAYRVQRESERAYHTALTQSHQERNSVFSCVAFTFGGALTRHDLRAVLNGEGAEATLDGLSVLRGRQHVDYHTTLDHAKPHCNSWEFFNGIFADRARGVFSGRIMVRPDAQKTDSKQTNNNLLLSRHARVDSQPQLEIYADDVKCTHGATLGPIDEKQLFYLQSRGLGSDEARALLTYGFAAEILSNVTLDALRERLDALVRQRLDAGGGAGR